MLQDGQRQMVHIGTNSARLAGMLALPAKPLGMVLFAHGSGSGRHSARNALLAAELRRVGLGTLIMDLLSAEEEHDSAKRCNIDLFAYRLGLAADWLARDDNTHGLPLGLFGAGTGAGGALQFAAARPDMVAALVSRGGRPDLGGPDALLTVRAPSLLIVGELDSEVIALNRAALAILSCEKHLEIVPGAGHLFEEPGRLDLVADLAAQWFLRHLEKQH